MNRHYLHLNLTLTLIRLNLNDLINLIFYADCVRN